MARAWVRRLREAWWTMADTGLQAGDDLEDVDEIAEEGFEDDALADDEHLEEPGGLADRHKPSWDDLPEGDED